MSSPSRLRMAYSTHDQRQRDPYQKKYPLSASAPLNTPFDSGKGGGIKRIFPYKCGSNQSIGKLYVLSEMVRLSTQNKFKNNERYNIYNFTLKSLLNSKFTLHLTCFNQKMSVKGYIDLKVINILWSSLKVSRGGNKDLKTFQILG